MKKLFITLALCAGFMSCSNDDDDEPGNPVTNIEIPQSSSENPIKAGETTTIKGKGFIESSEIWLRAITKSTDTEIKVEITTVTATAISFVAPPISGERSIVLKQSGQEYTIGKIYFETDNTPDPTVKKRITKLDYSSIGEISEFSYDANGRLVAMIETYIEDSYTDKYELKFSYNEAGKLISMVETDMETKEVETKIDFEYKDDLTIIAKEIQSKGGSSEPYISTLTLDEQGRLIKLTDENESFSYSYDEGGNVIKLLKKSVYTGETVYNYKYDDKKNHLANTSLPSWYWVHDVSNITKNYVYLYPGSNNMVQGGSEGEISKFRYDYDEDEYPTAIYYVDDDNAKVGVFSYELVK